MNNPYFSNRRPVIRTRLKTEKLHTTILTYHPTISAAPTAATYSLFPVPYSLNFTFSAKERDTETGLSYFGSRYYSSDLSIWLSVDPQAAKYPGLSPYVYCANNPIKLVDPNGEQWETPEDATFAKGLMDKAEKHIKQIENKIVHLTKQNAKYSKNNKIDKIIQNQKTIDYYNEEKSLLQEGVVNIKDMGNDSKYNFHFNTSNDIKSDVTQREIGNSRTIDINIYSGFQQETAWHECVHIGDWLQGKYNHIFSSEGKLGTIGGNKGNAEEHAYKSEFCFSMVRFRDKPVNSLLDINNQTYKLFEHVKR